MPIPPGFNNDLSLWFNQIVGDLGQVNYDLSTLRKYWAYLTQAQKDSIKTIIRNKITEGQSELTNVSNEINVL